MIDPRALAPAEEADAAAEVPAPGDPDASLFALSRARFVAGPARAGGSVLLFVSLFLFVLSLGRGATVSSVVILVGVLLVHELGHYLGMRVFGYRDVRMFFVPFLGAAVSGRRGNVTAWKDAVVLLLGPVPGVLLGTGALIATTRWPQPDLVQAGETLLIVNAFNLLPFGTLDGGRLLLRVIFSRHRYLELAFAGLGAVMLVLAAVALQWFALGIVAVLGLGSLPRRARVLTAATTLRGSMPDASPADLDDASARRLFDAARGTLTPPLASQPTAIATAMEDIHLATQRPPGILASMALLGAWALTFLVAVVTAVVLAHAMAPAVWVRHTFDGYSVELPGDPLEGEETWSTPAGPRTVLRRFSANEIVERFSVVAIDADTDIDPADRATWIAAVRARLEHDLGEQSASLASERELLVGGQTAVETVWRSGGRVWHARTVVSGRHVISLVASSPDESANASRFLDSLVLAP